MHEPAGKRSTIIAITLAAISACLFIALLLVAPKDRDAGPMMAYNFFFFFPATILSGVFAVLSMGIALSVFVRQKSLRNPLLLLAVVLSVPGILFFSAVAINLLRDDSEELADLYIPEPAFTHTEVVPLNDKDSLYLIGYRWGGTLKRKRIYISDKPYHSSSFSTNNLYHCQGDSTFQLFYTTHQDSLLIYIPDKEPLYRFDAVNENLVKTRVRAVQQNESQMDSLAAVVDTNRLQVFSWPDKN